MSPTVVKMREFTLLKWLIYSILSSFQEERKTTSSAKVSIRKGIVFGAGLDLKIPEKIAIDTNLPPAIVIAREQQNYFEYETEVSHKLKTEITVPPNETVRTNYIEPWKLDTVHSYYLQT